MVVITVFLVIVDIFNCSVSGVLNSFVPWTPLTVFVRAYGSLFRKMFLST